MISIQCMTMESSSHLRPVKVAGKETLSLYSPPQRLVIQSPCEVIREARASVMGLRAVPTTRPFTPKDKERVLFGGAKKGSQRPPSAVNLSYLQRQESIGRIKLPSINVPTKGKHRAATTRTRVSLDNLVEEQEQEQIQITTSTIHDLPGVRKSYSCPQERTSPSSILSPEPYVHPPAREGWAVIPRSRSSSEGKMERQISEPLVPKKKVHRLRSLPSDAEKDLSIDTDKDDDDNEEMILFSRIEADRVESISEPQQLVESTEEKMVVVVVDQSVETLEARKESDAAATEELKTEPEDSDDLVAVLSNGKLVWEVSPEKNKQEYEITVPPDNKEDDKARPQSHLENLRKNVHNVANRIHTLQTKTEKIGERVAKKERNDPNYSFHMNSNKRYHTSTKKTTKTGEKAYKKFAEGVQQEEEEVKKEETKHRKQEVAGWDFFWKNSYFRVKEEELDPALQYLQDVLEELRTVNRKEGDLADSEVKIAGLYTSLKSGEYFGQGCLPIPFKSKLLQTLYMFADSDRPRLLLYIARIVLALRVESGLPAACKMIFKVARNDTNDNLFIDVEDILELFLDGVGRASPLDAAESCIYGYGALKFLTMNPLLLSRALHLGALDLITLHLKMVNSSAEEGLQLGEQTQHALFQLTGTLRNIAAGDGAMPLFLTTNCVPALCKTLILSQGDEELVSNIARTLSLLSSDEDMTQVLLEDKTLVLTVVDLMRRYQLKDQILIRLSYSLGNILANSDVARVQLSRNEKCIPTLLNILETYMNKNEDENMETSSKEDSETQETIDDVIVKVIRVVANMSMNPVVGSNLSPATQEKGSLHLANLLTSLLNRKRPGPALFATLGCLNNISYYVTSHSCLVQLTKGVIGVLSGPSPPPHDCVIEASRVLGNLTRHKDAREFIFDSGGMITLEHLLEMDDPEVSRCICGVLVNMLLDPKTRNTFLVDHGIDKLIRAAERFRGDWVLAGLVCRGIWNACAHDIQTAITHNNMDQFLTTLANYLEEDNWKDGDADWEEFAGIATDLLERFNAHLETHG